MTDLVCQQGQILAFCNFCNCITEVRNGNNLLITLYTTPSLLKVALYTRRYGFQHTFWYETEIWNGKITGSTGTSSESFFFVSSVSEDHFLLKML